MPFNALLLPLLGGYFFITNWNRTRFDSKRYSGERLLFHAAAAGAFFLAASFILTRPIASMAPHLYDWWRAQVPGLYTGTSFLAFLFGLLTWYPANWFTDRDREAAKAVQQWGDYLEILLDSAIANTKQVSLTLRSGKVYIGFVTSGIDHAYDRKYMRLMPLLSGYRDDRTKELAITSDYAAVYAELVMGDDALDRLSDEFQVVIPVAEITSANLFDPEVYTLFAGEA